MIDTAKVQKYAKLYDKCKTAQKRADSLKADLLRLEDELRDEFVEAETHSVTTGGYLVHFQRELQVGVTGEDETDNKYARAAKVLRDTGYGHLVHERFNLVSLKSVIRHEIITDDVSFDEGMKAVPDEWRGIINILQTYRLRVKKKTGTAGAKRKEAK